jgi:hypothetical protein
MKPSLFLYVTQRRLVVADVSVQTVSPVFMGLAVLDRFTLEDWTIDCPETSISTNLRCVTSQKTGYIKREVEWMCVTHGEYKQILQNFVRIS